MISNRGVFNMKEILSKCYKALTTGATTKTARGELYTNGNGDINVRGIDGKYYCIALYFKHYMVDMFLERYKTTSDILDGDR